MKYIGLDVLGAGASAFASSAAQGSAAAGQPLWQQLAALDRALTPMEQAIVDAGQSGQASAMQAKAESGTFINPQTGQKTNFDIKDIHEDAPPRNTPPRDEGRSWWQYVIAGVGVLVLVGGMWLLIKKTSFPQHVRQLLPTH